MTSVDKSDGLEWDGDSNPLTVKRWKEYGFDPECLALYRLRDVSAHEAQELGFNKTADGIYIGYPEDRDSRIRWYRSGFQAQTEAGKYGQRYGTAPALYWPPTLVFDDWNNDNLIPILITEGEFKAIAVDYVANSPEQITVVPLGLGGVDNWQSRKLGIDMLQKMKEIKWTGRQVLIAFDMDMGNNPFVSLALNKLFNHLSSLGAFCRVLTWDIKQGKGIDDFLSASPVPRLSWNEIIAAAQQPAHVMTVLELNKRFAYVEREQKVWDSQNNGYISVKSFSSEFFTNRIKVQTSVRMVKDVAVPVMKEMPIGNYWLQSPVRQAVGGLQFIPGGEGIVSIDTDTGIPIRYLNTWKGWGVNLSGQMLKPEKGDVQPFYDFIYATFGNEDKKHCNYLIKRLAWIFQQPTTRHPTWIYIIGAPYQGKSSLIKLIAELVGQPYVSNIDESSLKKSFDEWRAEKLLVSLDDTAIKDRHATKQLLKRLTTENYSQVNKKWQSEYTAPNYTTFFFAANGVDAVLEHDDRRALVLSAECAWDFAKGEWNTFDRWRASREGRSALLHHLLYEVKLDADFLTEEPPKTMARELVIESGETGWDDFIYNLANPAMPLGWRAPASGQWRTLVPTIMTPEMIKILYRLVTMNDEKFEIRNGALSMKLARFYGKKALPADSYDARGRVMIDGHQLVLWTWDKMWLNRTREDYAKEYMRLMHEYPELAPPQWGGKGKY